MTANYDITVDGQVYSFKLKRYMKQDIKNGYYYVVIVENGKQKHKYIHRWLAEKYISNPEGLPQVNHKDGNRLNNSLSNLEWCSPRFNTLHSMYVLKNDHAKGNKIPTKIVETGEVFDSRAAVGRHLNCRVDWILDCCDHPGRTCKGYHIVTVKDKEDDTTGI